MTRTEIRPGHRAATPKRKFCMTSPTKTRTSSASPVPSPLKACRRIASSQPTKRHPNRKPREPESRQSIDFATMILDNLKKAGVQNTVKKGTPQVRHARALRRHLAASHGHRRQAPDGKPIRVAVSIGPEHGTVGPQQVKEAAKEAVLGIGFDILIVCGFAFDPHVAEEAKRYGKLTVLPARMNPDLLIGSGDESLLKNTGAGNLFMVFGEPDIDIRAKNGNVTVELKGLDVYDPTTARSATRPPMTSPVGSLTPTTTAKASSSARPISPAPTSHTRSSSAP